MAAMTENTWSASERIRSDINFIYKNRKGESEENSLWDHLPDLQESRDHLTWDQAKSWGFKEFQARGLWALVQQLQNLQRQQQMAMDQMYEAFNFMLAIDQGSTGATIEVNKDIHARQFSNKIHMLKYLAEDIIDSRFGTVGILKEMEEGHFDLLSQVDREKLISTLQQKFCML
ncbi:uncharacterized protein MELLADRAFT_102024 [Melampsora larici-populina 98AG31]|uniref:Uncharacterized protein n=1 Tax=Melampsora larici-populina (strain 98AG31 / pathotype 3-4-7) TaxID=747676 RepID=F4R5Q5_MELLP|nr:uncharacterized protein MELLADRAFT_102024 [Melampsora larici-populina 98AG31]EGG12087.1 hypothetical protein MELLADRAFT_102024 [Melampsora larici-populina 98AG31]